MMLPFRTLVPRAFALSLFTLLCLACERDPSAPLWPPTTARLHGLLDDEPFVAQMTARVKHTAGGPDTLFFGASRGYRGIGQLLGVFIEFDGVGEYPLGDRQVSLEDIVGGDVVVGSRAGSRPTPGLLTITEYDAAAGILRGTLRFSLTSSSPRTPDTGPVEFKDGTFVVQLDEPIGGF